ALSGCNQGQTTSGASAPTTSTATASAANTSALMPLVPASVTGAWSFDGECASENGLMLQPDGKAALGENEEGLSGIDAEGRLVVLTQTFEPGDLEHPPSGGGAAVYVFEMRAPNQDQLVSVQFPSANNVHARRCP